MANELAGKVAIVTGGARGMGGATVELFVAEGARVVIADILDEAGEALAARMGPSARYRHTDVSKPEAVQSVVDFAVAEFGGLDIMFNNAGILMTSASVDLLDQDFSTFDREFAVNLMGPVYGVVIAGREIAKRGGGSIINTASTTATFPGLSALSYRISKAGVISLTQNAALALGKYNIRVNAISPGPIETPILAEGLGLSPERTAELSHALFQAMADGQQAIKRIGQPDDVAHAALFLAGKRSLQITGTNLPVAGGEGMGDLADHSAELGALIQKKMADWASQ